MADQTGEQSSETSGHWSDWVALITAVLAVVTAFASAESSNASSAEILLQTQESDQWALYQSESLKSHAFTMQLELIDLLAADPTVQAKRDAAKKSYSDAIAKYAAQKVESDKKAKGLAEQRRHINAVGSLDTRSVIWLQVSIVLCSVAGLTKKRWLLGLGLASGLAGVGYFIAGTML